MTSPAPSPPPLVQAMTTLYKPRSERWPQVSLKGLFVLVTVLGVSLWLGVQVKWIRDRHEAIRWMDEHRSCLHVSDDHLQAWPDQLIWPIAVLGEKPVMLILIGVDDDASEGHLAHIERIKILFSESHVEIMSNAVN